MPKWTTHTEGGSWYGGGRDVRDCSSSQQDAVTDAFNAFIDNECLDCFPGLRNRLRDKWKDIEIDCTDPDCDELDGRNSGNKVLICDTSSNRVGPVLLHELVHACDGTELDSEAVEHACFNGDGATLPFGDDWDKFRSETGAFQGKDEEREGRYVIWNSDTGEVWGKRIEGGAWHSSDTVSKTERCFQSNSWKHDYGSGGGWF